MDLKNHDNGNGNTKLVDHVSMYALTLVMFGLRAIVFYLNKYGTQKIYLEKNYSSVHIRARQCR